ncbi:MAG: hypothetical protein LBS82_06620 [Spirochaetaceae bacterium]|jgi:hypothetical protein|nr:hypothetical protein [Spirochaetaceae bacterium]
MRKTTLHPLPLLALLLLLALPPAAHAQDALDADAPRGEAAIAEKYVEWAQNAYDHARYQEAEKALQRAQDYAEHSSDLSYLRALSQRRQGAPRRRILSDLELALATDRWNQYHAHDARALKASLLLELMQYQAALREIDALPASAEREAQRLEALRQLKENAAFRSAAAHALQAYPEDPHIAAQLFAYAAATPTPTPQDAALVDTALARLPVLLETSPTLIYQAAPFIPDVEDAQRRLRAQTARDPSPPQRALPTLLSLGVYDEDAAIKQLFTHAVIDKQTLIATYSQLRTDAARRTLINALRSFTGTIASDANNDAISEASCTYKNGQATHITVDTHQEGQPSLSINLAGGTPTHATTTIDAQPAAIDYETYPVVQRAHYRDKTYTYPPAAFHYAPIRFEPLCAPDGIPYPEPAAGSSTLSERTLLVNAAIVENPSPEIEGAIQQTRLTNGIPTSAQETLDGKIVSQTQYRDGTPHTQTIDADLDGRMETTRHFDTDTIQSAW